MITRLTLFTLSLALAASAAPAPHLAPHGAAKKGTGPLFEFGATFKYQGEEAKVWAHPDCPGLGPRPLVIFLHGSNRGPYVWAHPALDERYPPAYPDKKWMVHVGKLAQKMIDDGLVTPLVIVAPTNGGAPAPTQHQPWAKLDLKALIDAVIQTVQASGVQIDLDQVAVVGHSAGGGYPGHGLDKIAEAQAMFGGHKLKVFGITDTEIRGTSARYLKELGNNKTTAIYALHKLGGGWVSGGDLPGSNKAFGIGMGATHHKTSGFVGHEDPGSMAEDCYDNDRASPLRMTVKINTAKIDGYHAAWTAAGGYKTTIDDFHNDMVPLWAWWALPRFFPRR